MPTPMNWKYAALITAVIVLYILYRDKGLGHVQKAPVITIPPR